jgi:tetratricopeptide (TPR) repeat protein
LHTERNEMTKYLVAMLVSLFLPAATVVAQEPSVCGPLENSAYGPLDYRTSTLPQRKLVENAHFTEDQFTLRRGKTSKLGWDIGYTLRAFPNHPRALLAMQRLVEKEKRNPPDEAIYTIECYYERALRFQRDDHVVRMLYANFLIGKGQPDTAVQQLDYVLNLQGEDAYTQYNVGLLFFDMKNYDRALEHAHKAMSLGFNRQELKERLAAAGRWQEPAAKPAESADAAPPAASAP